jgi:hypothetical protein
MPAVLRCVILGMLLSATGLALGGVATVAAQTTTAPPASTSANSVPATATTAAPTTGDAKSSRTVNRIVLALLSLAGLLAILAIWLWRATKPKPSHLDGLDAMGSRRWRAASPEGRAALLAPVHERRGEIRDEQLIAEPDAAGEPDVEPAEPAVLELAAPELVEPTELAAPEPPEPVEPGELAEVAEVVAPEPGEPVEPDEPAEVAADELASPAPDEHHGAVELRPPRPEAAEESSAPL